MLSYLMLSDLILSLWSLETDSGDDEPVGACTSQGVEGVVQFLFVLIEALQGVFSFRLGSVDSVQQLVEVL